jgi:DNA repair exonuclease SbcCD ATPase subunit
VIVFTALRYQNFLSSGNVFTEIPLNKWKNTLIVGENGAGKSTMLDALCFVLYNKSFRKVNKPQLINSINGKNLLVEVEFSIGAKTYMVRRGMKPTIFEIWQDGEMINQNAAQRDYQEYLEKHILKLNHKSFSQVVILGSANFTPFMKLPAQGRREVIEDLLDIQIFSVMNTILKDKVSQNRFDIQSIESQIMLLEGKIELNEQHLKAMKQSNQELIDRQNDKIATYRNENQDLAEKSAHVSNIVTALQTEIEDQIKVSKKSTTLRDFKRDIEEKASKFGKEIRFYEKNDNCPTCKQAIDPEFKERIISTRNAKTKELQEGLVRLRDEIQAVELRLEQINGTLCEIRAHNQTISDLNTKIASNNRFISSIEDEIAKIKSKMKDLKDEHTISNTLKQQLAEQHKLKEQAIEDREILSIVSVLLKDGGIKTKIIRQYIPIMYKLISKYLAAMDFFCQFELDENFQETIRSRYRDDFSYESFSEGEKMRIDISLLFAWRAIAKLRNSASTNLLIMDEVFDGSLDADGIEEFLKILTNLTGDTNVFIISHKQDQMGDKFDQTLAFQKVKNFSQMVVR